MKIKISCNKLFRLITSVVFLCLLSLNSFAQNISKNWISISYLKCLENELPCECQKKEIHTLIRFDTLYTVTSELDTIYSYATIYDGIIYDPETYELKKENKSTFLVYYTPNETEFFKDSIYKMGTLEILNDTLYYSDYKAKSKTAFVNYGNTGDDEWTYTKEHIYLLDSAFIKRKYPSLESILHTTEIHCNCNKELGLINLISGKKDDWILKKNNDTLYIYKWTNAPKAKQIDPKIKKQLIQKYKW